MSYNVTIKYYGVAETPEALVAPICRLYTPSPAYIDTPPYVEGLTQDEEKKYGPSVYATNRDGWGNIEVAEPFATTSVPFPLPLAQFKLAVVGEDFTDEDTGKTGKKVEFEVADYAEAFYYKQLGVQMADQGFEVTVEAAQAAESH